MKTYSDAVHECLVNTDKAKLAALLSQEKFQTEKLCADIYVDLIQLRWDNDTIMQFAKHATDDMLAVLVSTAILQSHVIPLGPLFDLMTDSQATISKHQLQLLFLTACDHEDTDAVKAMIAHKCFNPADGRAITTVIRRQGDRRVLDDELISTVLKAHPGHKDVVTYLLDHCVSLAKHDTTKATLKAALESYG